MGTENSTFNWRSDDSNDNKAAVVAERFGGNCPDYLWYELGAELKVSDVTLHAALAPLFGAKNPAFGNVEMHPSQTASIARCLRVRNANGWQPRLSIGGRDCYLYMIGHSSDGRHFSFEEQWVQARFRPGTRVAVPESFNEFSVGANGRIQYSILPRPDEVFTVIETRFDSAARQAFLLSELIGGSAILANAIMAGAVNSNGLWSIHDSTVEVVQVTDIEGSQRELCAGMVRKVAD